MPPLIDHHPTARRYCDACERGVPATGCEQLDRYTFCRGCWQEYLLAWTLGQRRSPGQYVRDKRFGEGPL